MFSKLWSSFAASYLRLSERRPALILSIALVFACLGLWLAQRIVIEPSLEALLPDDNPALPAIAEMSERVPGSSPLFLLVSSEDAALTHRLARKVMEGASAWPETIYALDRRDPTYFLDHKLLFLPEKDILDLAYQIEDIVDFEECKAMPGCVNLDARPDTPTEESIRDKIAKVPEVKTLLSLFGVSELPHESSSASKQTPQKTGHAQPDDSEGRLGDLCSPDGHVCAVQVILDGNPSNLAYAEKMLAKSEALFSSIRPKDAPASLKMATSGRYRNAPMSKQLVAKDLRNTASLSTALMALLVLLQFRGLRAFILIFVPLLFAGAWTAGVIALVHPQLNVISAFTLAVLAGLGIDFGIHMLTQYSAERKKGAQPVAALGLMLDKLMSAMGLACVTTACGFGALLAAKFRGFAEMGGLAALGVALALLAFVLLFSPLVMLCHRLKPEGGSLIRSYRLSLPLVKRPMRLARMIAIAGIVIGAVCAVVSTRVSFEYDFRKLTPKLVGHGIRWGEAMHSTTRLATVMLADSQKDLEETAASLRAKHPERAKDEEAWLLTPASFVPQQQEERLRAIAKLRTAFDRAYARLSEKEKDEIAYVRPMLEVKEPITANDLPRWVREWLTERDGRFGTFGLLYNNLRGSDARAMEQLASDIAKLREEYPKVHFASAEALLGIIVPGLRSDAPTMLLLAIAGLFASTLLISRSLRKTLMVILPVALAGCASLALMVALDLHVNLYNMLVFPLSLGIGIDGAVYIVWVMSKYSSDTQEELRVTMRGVLGSTLTTAAGFGSMVVANNPGLVSLGELAIVTLSCALLSNLLWLPAWMYTWYGPQDTAIAASSNPS